MPPEEFVPRISPPADTQNANSGDGTVIKTGAETTDHGDEQHVSPVAVAAAQAWAKPAAAPAVDHSDKGGNGTQTAKVETQTLDLNTPALFERVSQNTTKPNEVQQEVDPKFAALLNNPKIDRTQSNGTDNPDDPSKGRELPERKAEDIKNIQVRVVQKDASGNKVDQNGNPVTDDANYTVGADGKIKELIPPNKKAYGDGDDRVVIEIDASETNAVNAANDAQRASASALISEIQANAANAGVVPDIPPDLYQQLNPHPAPPPRTVMRNTGGGGSAGGDGYGGGNGGNPGGGMSDRGGFTPPARPAQRAMRDAPGATQASHVDMSKFDVKGLKDVPESLKPTVQKMLSIISKHEGSPTSINWNDNGYGISVGMFQANQKAGELPTLLKRMHDDDPQKFAQVFGKYADKMLDENFVRNTPITKGSELGNMMQNALNQDVFQKTQLNMFAEKIVKCAGILKEKTGITSEEGVMLYTDAVNQLGYGGAQKYLRQGMSVDQLDAAMRSGSSWRSARNPGVRKDIELAGLSKQQGSFDIQNA